MAKLLMLALATFFTGHVFAKTVEDSCPQQLVARVNDRYLKVYQNSCFYFSLNGRKTYFDARDQCKKYGGTLAVVNNEAINNFLVYTLNSELRYYRYVWIGLNDVEKEGNYVWEDGTRVVWNNFEWEMGWDRKEDCIAIEPDTGVWHDTECDEFDWFSWAPGKYAYICQFASKKEDPKQEVINDPSDDDKNTGDDENKADESKKEEDEGYGKIIHPTEGKDTNKETPDDNKDNNKRITVQTTPGTAEEGGKKQDEDRNKDESVNEDTDELVDKNDEEDGTERDDTGCLPFTCGLDCGMRGYILDANQCQSCKCNP